MHPPALMRFALRLGLLVTLVLLALGACGGNSGGVGSGEAAGAEGKLDRVVEIEEGRGLYVRCTGSGSPTVVMEAGDEVDSFHYINVEGAVSEKTRTCVYDRAGLGKSDPAPPAPAAGSGRGSREASRRRRDPRPLRPRRDLRRRVHRRRLRRGAPGSGIRHGLGRNCRSVVNRRPAS